MARFDVYVESNVYRYNEELRTRMKENVEEALEKAIDGLDDDILAEARVMFYTYPTITTNVCEGAVYVEMSQDLAQLDPDTLSHIICVSIDNANYGTDLKVSPVVEDIIYNKMWRIIDRSFVKPMDVAHTDKVIRDALTLLKRKGLLDDLPEGVKFTSEIVPNTARRVIYIPKSIDNMCGGGPDMTVMEVAMALYKYYLADHIVEAAMHGLCIPESEEETVKQEQIDWAQNALECEE